MLSVLEYLNMRVEWLGESPLTGGTQWVNMVYVVANPEQ